VFCKRRLFSLGFIALIFGASCQRQPNRPAIERIAILRFENLGADASTMSNDWMGRAFSEIVTSELNGAPGLYAIPSARLHAVADGLGVRPVSVPGISAEHTAALASGATRIAYGQYEVRGGKIEVQVTVEDALTGKMTVLNPVSVPAGDIVPAASAVAHEISPRALAYGTQNSFVVETYVEALEHMDAAGAGNLQKAIAADPDFGPSYRQLAQFRARQGDLDVALQVLDQGLARGSALPESERARIQLERASLRNDPDARIAALAAVAKSDSSDPQIWQDLGGAAMLLHRYAQAEEAYRKVLDMQPDAAELWNMLAYAAAWAGDTATAQSALERYRKLAPAAPNPPDSLGDINLMAGHLAEAEKYYIENARKNPQFYAGLDFLKAALAHLMTGDVAGADALAQQYFDSRASAQDLAVDYRKAQWAWISGRRKEACRQMQQVAAAAETGAGRNLASHAYTEVAIWTLMLGNREPAAALAQKAAALATPASAVQVTLARFLTQPPASPGEWTARAATLVRERPQAPIGKMALADGLLLSKQYADALPVLQAMYDSGNSSADEGLPILLAWAEVETGHIAEAAPLLRWNPPLSDGGLSWSTPLYFPRIFYLRAVVAEKQGKSGEASENWRIFRTLSGPDPLLWGEEQKAPR
jgi:Flp pilus assembly protein TadD